MTVPTPSSNIPFELAIRSRQSHGTLQTSKPQAYSDLGSIYSRCASLNFRPERIHFIELGELGSFGPSATLQPVFIRQTSLSLGESSTHRFLDAETRLATKGDDT